MGRTFLYSFWGVLGEKGFPWPQSVDTFVCKTSIEGHWNDDRVPIILKKVLKTQKESSWVR